MNKKENPSVSTNVTRQLFFNRRSVRIKTLFISPGKSHEKMFVVQCATSGSSQGVWTPELPYKKPFCFSRVFFLEMDLGTFIYSQAPAVETHSQMSCSFLCVLPLKLTIDS